MIHFVVHDENDSVGVVVVEGVKAGARLTGWIMEGPVHCPCGELPRPLSRAFA